MAEQAESAPPRELSILLRFTEQAEERVQATFRQVEAIAARLRQDVAQLGVVTQGIADEVLAVRLLPVATVFVPFERMVRDLAQAQAKEIRLQLEGSETEIDRKILEQLRDPLLHMVRNAVDHGIESPDERRARGKPRTGTIRLEATHRGGAIEIQVADDGAGLDPARLRESAVARGLLSREQATALTAQAAIDLIFEPGFSTSSTVTETSGRGVGMDVVREHLERLNGRISTASSPGAGTSFTLQVPLTLATTRAILVEQGGQLFAIPTSMVERNHRVRERDLVSIEGKQTVAIEGHPVPIVELADVLEQPRATTEGPGAAQWRPFFVLRQDGRRVAVLADQLIGEQEIVVKPLGWPLRRVRNVGGAAMLGSGQTIAILNTSDMLKTAMQIAGASERPGTLAARAPQRAPRQRYVLVVDDSLPARTVQRSILEVAGYGTAVATDGAEALKVLHSQPIDLVISDVEMPTLDGFALTAEIRRDEKLRQIPVVLVTSLGAREHRERGVSVGADAYIVKGDFDQGQLLDTVGRLLP
jgi:two-component system chemotaxis sensor kinase CheA